MITYKEVMQLAKQKSYEEQVGGFRLMYGDNAPDHDVIDEQSNLVGLSLIQKWLRDIHEISVVVEDNYATMDFVVRVRRLWDMPSENGYLFSTYEQALLEGINEALKLI